MAKSTTLDFLIIDVPGRGKGTNKYGLPDPYTMIFVYRPQGGLIVRGWATETKEYVKKHFPIALMNIVYFGSLRNQHSRNKKHYRNRWTFRVYDKIVYIKEPCGGAPNNRSRHYEFKAARNNEYFTLLKLRRLPKKWIPEYNNIVNFVLGTDNI